MYLKSARSESLLGIFWEKGTQSPISTQASTDGQFYYLVLTELIVWCKGVYFDPIREEHLTELNDLKRHLQD